MTCPICGGPTKVPNCIKETDRVLRVRLCTACGHKFYTTEAETSRSKFDFKRAVTEKSRQNYSKRKSKGVKGIDERKAP